MKQHEDKFDLDDPRLSAYALGELEGAERAEVEALLERDPAARAFVAELAATADSLRAEFAAEAAPELTAAQRAAIAAQSAPVLRPRRWVWLGAAAAGILAVGVTWALLGRERGRVDEIQLAQNEGKAQRYASGDVTRHVTEGVEASAKPAASELYSMTALTEKPAGSPDGGEIVLRDDSTLAQDESEVVGVAGYSGSAVGVGAAPAAAAPGAPSAPSAPGRPTVAYGRAAGGKSKARSGEQRERVSLVAGGDQLEPGQLPALDPAGHNTEAYKAIVENAFKRVGDDPLSTFSIDVDTASYANVRRFLNSGALPPPDAVRIEELLNYFRYEYPKADGAQPFSVNADVAGCPWKPAHRLVRVGLRGQDIDLAKRQPSNLVFLIDVSGSMDQPDKLPLLVSSMKLLVEQLDGRDKLSMVVYAGSSGLVLPATTCDYKTVILNALEALQAGGSTNGGAGIELAYKTASENFIKEGVNRVVLCTDGDFNVGTTDEGSLVRLIEEKRQSGVFLSVLGFGTGNVQDSKMEALADKGNGNYAYVDTLNEARKVLVHEMGGTLFTIAKDVKIQVEFNPALVQAWRLIGYENRVLAHQDFNDDKKDAGEIGAGHQVTALYEVVPVGVAFEPPGVDPLKYQVPAQPSGEAFSGELLNLKLRYKAPDGETSKLIETPVRDAGKGWQEASHDFKFAAAVAGFGMVLRKSEHCGAFGLLDVLNLATQGVGEDVGGYRKEFVELVKKAQGIGGPKVR